MKRRNFLAALGIFVAGAGTARQTGLTKKVGEYRPPKLWNNHKDLRSKIKFDKKTKTISWIGPKDEQITVLDLHRHIQELEDEEYFNDAANDLVDITATTKSERSHDALIRLLDGWRITDETAKNLKSGTLVQDNAYFCSSVELTNA